MVADAAWLSATLAEEKSSAELFTAMPFYYAEIAWLLLSSWSRDDIPDAERVAELLQDIEAIRRHKYQVGVDMVLGVAATQQVPRQIDLGNATAQEVNNLRSSFFKVWRVTGGVVHANQHHSAFLHMQLRFRCCRLWMALWKRAKCK